MWHEDEGKLGESFKYSFTEGSKMSPPLIPGFFNLAKRIRVSDLYTLVPRWSLDKLGFS